MGYGVRVEYNGVDVSSQVGSFSIDREEAYCDVLELEILDPALYAQMDFSVIENVPRIEVFTRVDTTWVSQGKFFVEKPTFSVNRHTTAMGVWGRSTTALLGEPFTAKISLLQEEATTFFAICESMCTLCGIVWDSTLCTIADYTIFPYTLQVESLYPIEVISKLVTASKGNAGIVTCSKDGKLVIGERLFSTVGHSPVVTLTQLQSIAISEDIEYPEFANRVKISSAGSTSSLSVDLKVSPECLSDAGVTRLMVRVIDQEGLPLPDMVVSWTLDNNLGTLLVPHSNTQTAVIHDETKKASSFNTIELDFPPANIISIFAAKDTARADNLADGLYTISGNTIVLATPLAYCDQTLLVTYEADGIAINYYTAGSTPGVEKVTASVGGSNAYRYVFVENPCKCAPSITLKAFPSSIKVGANSDLLVYAEIGGVPIPDGRKVYMTLASSPTHGSIEWTEGYLGLIAVENEVVNVTNEIRGISQCTLSMVPTTVTGVWVATFDADGNPSQSGGNIFGSFSGKVITLTADLETETQLVVNYTARGCALNLFRGLKDGTDKIKAFVITSREAPAEAFCTVSVSSNPADDDSDKPDGCCDDGLCDQEGSSCDPDPTQCENGKVYCKRGGVDGCYTQAECDTTDCPEGQVNCYKDGAAGCFPSNECDDTYIEGGGGNRYGMKSGQLGCWPVIDLDPCGTDPITKVAKVTCYKDGKLNCVAPEECDTTYGKTGAVECSALEQCCVHKVTGKRGCYESGDCRAGGGGSGGGSKPPKIDPSGGESCTGEDGTTSKCKKGEKCCTSGKTKKKGCTPELECEDSGWGCSTKDCQAEPTEDCLQGRFGLSLSLQCTCDEICNQEFDRLGTTQGYNGSSYKPVTDIALEEGLTEGTEEYNSRVEELTEEAMADCIEKCGGCAAYPEIEMSGSDAVTKPGAYQYSVNTQMEPTTWEVAGQGATISDTGMVTLDDTACGSFTVTATDKCGKTVSMDARITNAGQWVVVEFYEYCYCYTDPWSCNRGTVECIVGKYFYSSQLVSAATCGCPAPSWTERCGICEDRTDLRLKGGSKSEWRC